MDFRDLFRSEQNFDQGGRPEMYPSPLLAALRLRLQRQEHLRRSLLWLDDVQGAAAKPPQDECWGDMTRRPQSFWRAAQQVPSDADLHRELDYWESHDNWDPGREYDDAV